MAFSQTVTKKDTLNGTPLIMNFDPKIDAVLENAEEYCNRLEEKEFKGNNNVSETKTKIEVEAKPMSQAEICRKNPKMMGYKIQLAVVKSNDEAKEVGLYFRKKFPSMKVQVDASLRPNYKILAGSYFKRDGASSDLRKIREFFKEAMVIQYSIFCAEAK